MARDSSTHNYDVCLSFAGEQRDFVRDVASRLRSKGIRVFYDENEKAQLWGKDLYAHLDDIYQNLARFCVVFASAEYAQKVWSNHERRSAQARAIKEHGEYLLPARFDDTPIPGVPDTVGYIDLRKTSPAELAELIDEKLGARSKENYLPPVPDRLFERLGIGDDVVAQEAALSQAYSFLGALRRMNATEREIVFRFFQFGCPAELPDNVHIYVDLLRRVTEFSPAKLRRILGGLRSLGFACRDREGHDEEAGGKKPFGRSPMFELEWNDLSDVSDYPAMAVASEMISGATEGYCEAHGIDALRRLDFSQLAAVTTSEDHH
jgi:hypothetical protein